jgi:hypothetical protein
MMTMIYRGDYPERTEEEEQERQRKLDEAGERKFEERHEEIGMEQISEERQRKVYEWLYPFLAGKEWHTDGEVATWEDGQAYVESFYLCDGQPNYQFFFTEIAPRLVAEGCTVTFRQGHNEFVGGYYKVIWGGYPAEIHEACHHDPIAATAEYIEALEGR